MLDTRVTLLLSMYCTGKGRESEIMVRLLMVAYFTSMLQLSAGFLTSMLGYYAI